MRNLAVLSLFIASVATARADQFIGDIFKVDGNKVLVSRSVVGLDKKLKSKLVTLTVAEKCTITRSDPPNKKKPVEDGLKSDIFKASPIKAGITTDGDKITAINVLSFRPVKTSKG